jgi:hypothetical protein
MNPHPEVLVSSSICHCNSSFPYLFPFSCRACTPAWSVDRSPAAKQKQIMGPYFLYFTVTYPPFYFVLAEHRVQALAGNASQRRLKLHRAEDCDLVSML